MVPYVDAVVAVTVMRVLLFVLHVGLCMLRVCEGAMVKRCRKYWCGAPLLGAGDFDTMCAAVTAPSLVGCVV